MIQNKVFQSIAKAIPKQSQSILKYSKVSQSIPKHPKVSQSSNGKKLPPQNSPLHSLILVCTFIDFEKILPPARLFCPARLMFFKNFSTCTFISACTSIRYTRVVRFRKIAILQPSFSNKLFLKLNLSKNDFSKSCCPKLIFFNDFFFRKDLDNF